MFKINKINNIKIVKNTILKDNIFYLNRLNNTYLTFGINFINLKLISKNVVALSYNNNSNKNYLLNSTKIEFYILNTIYPIIYKFKLIGRHFKIRKRTKKFLYCSLNYAHKYYFINNIINNFIKFKKKKNRLLFIVPFKLNSSAYTNYYLNKLRGLNFYTNKGIKSLSKYKLKRRGKGPMS